MSSDSESGEVMSALDSNEPPTPSRSGGVKPVLDSTEPPAPSCSGEVISALDSHEPPGPPGGSVVKSVMDSNEPPAPSCSSGGILASPNPLGSGGPGPSGSRASSGRAPKRMHLYTEEVLNMWNMERILAELGTVEQCIAFSEDRGLISATKNCRYHRSPMTILTSKGSVCRTKSCKKRMVARSIGTWFENIKLPLPVVFKLMYCYARDYDYYQARIECSSRSRGIAVSEATICDWYSYCRETVVVHQLENQQERPKIGGPGKVVQLDESKFGRRKYNRGRRVEGHWVLGMVDDETNELRLEVCPNNERSAEVLIPLIKKHVAEGSIIHTDCWRAYDSLPTHGYIHKKVNHSNPENPFIAEDGTHTQHIESQWRNLKRRFHKVNYKENFEDWLIEYLWRTDIRKSHLDSFEELLKIAD
ncbi:unnamed protein product [Colias eurytheme]|nr:unnamed protein product [Colias eurytheme]